MNQSRRNDETAVRGGIVLYSSPSSSSSASGSPKWSTWPARCPANTQCGPFASSETKATSHGRARYATATQPQGSPSSASNSNTVGGLDCLSTVAVVMGSSPCRGTTMQSRHHRGTVQNLRLLSSLL